MYSSFCKLDFDIYKYYRAENRKRIENNRCDDINNIEDILVFDIRNHEFNNNRIKIVAEMNQAFGKNNNKQINTYGNNK